MLLGGPCLPTFQRWRSTRWNSTLVPSMSTAGSSRVWRPCSMRSSHTDLVWSLSLRQTCSTSRMNASAEERDVRAVRSCTVSTRMDRALFSQVICSLLAAKISKSRMKRSRSWISQMVSRFSSTHMLWWEPQGSTSSGRSLTVLDTATGLSSPSMAMWIRLRRLPRHVRRRSSMSWTESLS